MVVAVCCEQLTLERSLTELAWKNELSENGTRKKVEDSGNTLNKGYYLLGKLGLWMALEGVCRFLLMENV